MTAAEKTTCLVSALNRCKQSSKEAVENLQQFSSFKEYMHIKRKVEEELETLIKNAQASDRSQLILVCGGVGDGKSHIISYLKRKHSFLDKEFYLHNDATESFEPQKTSIETLAEKFWDFTDEALSRYSGKKAILAINLGALSNFIDSDQGKAFSKLREFVEQKQILETAIVDNTFDPNSTFQFVNFSDFHLFQLTEDGPKSDYMTELLDKITGFHENNPFYKAYQSHCLTNCPVQQQCPIKHNYELLMSEVVQKKIVDVLIQSIVKEKLIISTRALLNFIHDIIVATAFESLTDEQVKEKVGRQSFEEYVDQMMPVLMFTKPDISPIHHATHKLSPTQVRSDQIDNKYIEFRSRKNGVSVFEEHVDMQMFSYLHERLQVQSPWDEANRREMEKEFQKKLIKLFVLLYYFVPQSEENSFTDPIYEKFMRYLFFWNTNQIRLLADLYSKEARDAIYRWDGEGDGDHLYVQIGQAQTQYHSLQKLEIQPNIDSRIVPSSEKVLDRFLLTLTLSFKPKGRDQASSDHAEVNLDFALYELMVKIRNGYRPNKKDKLQFINFVDFIHKLSAFGNQDEEIVIEEREANRTVRYSLKVDIFGQYEYVEM